MLAYVCLVVLSTNKMDCAGPMEAHRAQILLGESESGATVLIPGGKGASRDLVAFGAGINVDEVSGHMVLSADNADAFSYTIVLPADAIWRKAGAASLHKKARTEMPAWLTAPSNQD